MQEDRSKLVPELCLENIYQAQNRIYQFLRPTPLVYNHWISDRLGSKVYLKLESHQPIGSFKIRGALNRLLTLTEEEKKKGVVAASAGNHAQGVSYASRALGIGAQIVMPITAPLVKVENTRALGAEVVLHGENYDEAFSYAQKLEQEFGRVFVHAFEDPAVIAGQGTLALEILEQLPEVDTIVASAGGGGLCSGIGTVLKSLRPEVHLVGCQSIRASSIIRTLGKSAIPASEFPDPTFADGILVKKTSAIMAQTISPLVDEWVEVDDEQIALAVVRLLEKAKTIVEGAGAITLSALEKIKESQKGKKVVLVLSGGNIDVNLLTRIIDLGLVEAGRRLRLNVWIPDRPGSLAQLTRLIADHGGSVLQAIHDRNAPFTFINQTEVFLALETRGHSHSEELIEALKEKVIRLERISGS